MTKMTATAAGWTVKVPAGEYFLGDPCYAVPDKEWSGLLESCAYFGLSANELGDVAERCGNPSPVGTLSTGVNVVAFHTKYGDGEYPDQHGNTYPVDAGLIGLVPVEAIAKNRDDLDGLGEFVMFTTEVECKSDGDGVLEFGNYVIDTSDEESDEEDYDPWA